MPARKPPGPTPPRGSARRAGPKRASSPKTSPGPAGPPAPDGADIPTKPTTIGEPATGGAPKPTDAPLKPTPPADGGTNRSKVAPDAPAEPAAPAGRATNRSKAAPDAPAERAAQAGRGIKRSKAGSGGPATAADPTGTATPAAGRAETTATPPGAAAAGDGEGGEPTSVWTGPWVEWSMRVAGTLVGVALGFVTAVYEVYLTPLRLTTAGHARVPVAVLLAIAANAALVWFTHKVTGRVGPALLPGLAWLLVMLVAGNRTAEGDLLITGDNWVGVATILCGAVAWAIAGYMVILRVKRGPRPPKE